VRVVAGRTAQGTEGAIRQPLTDPYYFDVSVPTGSVYEDVLPAQHNAFVYLIEGALLLPDMQGVEQTLREGGLAVLTQGARVTLTAGERGARFLLVAGRPLKEPVARGGPFVMNTQEEILQAFRDHAEGRLGRPLSRDR